ncbi:Uncharacterised protein [Serratia fonticola]|nr:Uncharacterised protein [Serratia fonticola]
MRTKVTIRGIWLSATVIGLHWPLSKIHLASQPPCSYLTFQYQISSKAIIQPTKLVLHLQLAGKDRTKSRTESTIFRRSKLSQKVDDPSRTHSWILRPREIIVTISGCSNAQLSRPFPNLTSIPSSRAAKISLPSRSQAQPPNIAFSVKPDRASRSSRKISSSP